ncbi:DoxX family protein [Sphingomonas daechungensis]|uniref:DoxX family protein n=1 Tax=Sphingomonas daechungensis TaxID=1176646 RepID=A0ABX6T1R6_9SPHN|nr:DoxX family protein [Sphingomonas daechungensis]QNP43772.1 DoxX family protein [Sphingomonas daechungensis]
MNAAKLSRYEPIALGLLRIMSGLLFLEHGLQKFLSFPPGKMAGFGWTFAGPPAYAGVIELICGFLITVGWLTRPAAFVASGTMAVAYFLAHAPQDFFPVNNMGDAAILYCFVFLYLVFRGPGALSIEGDKRAIEVS